jgi:hypothetical protein
MKGRKKYEALFQQWQQNAPNFRIVGHQFKV